MVPDKNNLSPFSERTKVLTINKKDNTNRNDNRTRYI